MIKIDKIIRTRRKSISIEILKDARLVVRAPRFVPVKYIEKLIKDKSLWIQKKQNKIAKNFQKYRPLQKHLLSNAEAYKQEAQYKIKNRLDYYSALTGLKYKKFKISNAKTRWGSCSPQGNLNFSWKLTLAPVEVLDYVIVHELVHLQIKNHSQRFWNQVKKFYPNYKQGKKWLKDKGYLLS